MSSHPQRKGFAVTVCDIDGAKMDRVAAYKAASIAKASHGQDIVITALPATQHVEPVVLGEDGCAGQYRRERGADGPVDDRYQRHAVRPPAAGVAVVVA